MHLTTSELAHAAGVSITQIAELTKAAKMPRELYRKSPDSNAFVYAPSAVAFMELVARLRGFFGHTSKLPLELARAATPNVLRLWHEGCPPGTRLKIYVPGAEVVIPADFIEVAKGKLPVPA